MPIPTEPIGSIPRPAALIEGMQAFQAGRILQKELNTPYTLSRSHDKLPIMNPERSWKQLGAGPLG